MCRTVRPGVSVVQRVSSELAQSLCFEKTLHISLLFSEGICEVITELAKMELLMDLIHTARKNCHKGHVV